MKYLVNELAEIAGISVRTLHHYDHIDLLKPMEIGLNGYRFYGWKELLRLQQILFFRELDFSLEEIRVILDSPDLDQLEILNEQKAMLQLKQKKLKKLIFTINNTIINMKDDKKLPKEDLFDGFNDMQSKAYKKEARKRWGHTKAWKQYEERMKNLKPKDMEKLKKEGEAILRKIVSLMKLGPASHEVQKEVAAYHDYMGNFYDCSKDHFLALGRIYSEDERFRKYYEDIQEGLAEFMTEAIAEYCS